MSSVNMSHSNFLESVMAVAVQHPHLSAGLLGASGPLWNEIVRRSVMSQPQIPSIQLAVPSRSETAVLPSSAPRPAAAKLPLLVVMMSNKSAFNIPRPRNFRRTVIERPPDMKTMNEAELFLLVATSPEEAIAFSDKIKGKVKRFEVVVPCAILPNFDAFSAKFPQVPLTALGECNSKWGDAIVRLIDYSSSNERRKHHVWTAQPTKQPTRRGGNYAGAPVTAPKLTSSTGLHFYPPTTNAEVESSVTSTEFVPPAPKRQCTENHAAETITVDDENDGQNKDEGEEADLQVVETAENNSSTGDDQNE